MRLFIIWSDKYIRHSLASILSLIQTWLPPTRLIVALLLGGEVQRPRPENTDLCVPLVHVRSLHQRLLALHPGEDAVKSRLSETVPWYKGPISEREYSVSRDDVISVISVRKFLD